MRKLAIIGGGAAGLAAGIACADRLAALGVGANITVFERDDRVGRSILATGNGRCNFSNAHIDPALYTNAGFVARVLDALEEELPGENGLDAVHSLFADLGLVWREEADGRQYPLANKASSVLDVLRAALAKRGVAEACERTVVLVDPPRKPGDHWALRMEDGAYEHVDAVVVACGGALDVLQVGTWERPRTRLVLGPLLTETSEVRELNNIRAHATVSLLRSNTDGGHADGGLHVVAAEAGEVMFRKYGVSGIAVFNLSRLARKGDVVSIDFLAGVCSGDVRRYLNDRLGTLAQTGGGNPTFDDMMRGLVLPQVAQVLLKRCGFEGDAPCTRRSIERLAHVLASFELTVQGVAEKENCQVHRGGYAPGLLDSATLEARGLPGLFMAGEALDVDAPCGGFNLHWAWASGMLAGIGAARRLAEV